MPRVLLCLFFLGAYCGDQAAAEQPKGAAVDFSRLTHEYLSKRFGNPIAEKMEPNPHMTLAVLYGKSERLCEAQIESKVPDKDLTTESLTKVIHSLLPEYSPERDVNLSGKSISNTGGEDECLGYKIEIADGLIVGRSHVGCVKDRKAGERRGSILRLDDECRHDARSMEMRALQQLPGEPLSTTSSRNDVVLSASEMHKKFGVPKSESFRVGKDTVMSVDYGPDGIACTGTIDVERPIFQWSQFDNKFLDEADVTTLLKSLLQTSDLGHLCLEGSFGGIMIDGYCGGNFSLSRWSTFDGITFKKRETAVGLQRIDSVHCPHPQSPEFADALDISSE